MNDRNELLVSCETVCFCSLLVAFHKTKLSVNRRFDTFIFVRFGTCILAVKLGGFREVFLVNGTKTV